MMNVPEEYLPLGLSLLSGCTALLVLGLLAMKFSRNPALRQRVGEATLLATIFYLVLACIPLDLPSREWIGATFTTNEENVVALEPAGEPRIDEKDRSGFVIEPSSKSEETLSVSNLPTKSKPPVKTNHTPQPEVSKTSKKLLAIAADSFNRREAIESTIDNSATELRIVTETFAAESSPAWDWRRVTFSVYFLGVVVCLNWLLFGRLCLMFFLRRTEKPSTEIDGLLESISSDYLSRPPRLLVSHHRSRAFSCGLFRPTIVVPASFCKTEERNCLRTVLLHELAHIVRRDAQSRMLFNLAFPLLYFHPVYWWIRRDVNFSSELIADDWAANFSTPLEYAEELTSMKRLFAGRIPIMMGSNNFFSTRHDFTRRITMLLQRKSPLANKINFAKKFVVYGFFAALLSGLAMTTGIRDLAANDTTSITDDNPFVTKNSRTNTNPFKSRKDAINNKTNNPFQKRDSGKSKIGAFQSQKSKRSEEPEQSVRGPQQSTTVGNRASIGTSSYERPLDLMQLATQYSNAIETISSTSFELKKSVETNKRLRGTIPELEIERLQNLLRLAEQKKSLFYTIGEAELELTLHDFKSVQEEIEEVEDLYKAGAVSKSRVRQRRRELTRLKTRLRVLGAILQRIIPC